jgi:hypothetical protein
MTLLTLLQTYLPADWKQGDPFRFTRLFPSVNLINTIECSAELTVGTKIVRVIQDGSRWCVECSGCEVRLYTETEADLFACIVETVATVALSQNPIPTVPAWVVWEISKQRGRKIGECDDRIDSLYEEIQRTEEEKKRLRAYNPCIGS